MAAKKQIFISQKSHEIKILKTTFPKEFFNKTWFIVEEHEHIYIFEIKFDKNIQFKNKSQNKFCDNAQ